MTCTLALWLHEPSLQKLPTLPEANFGTASAYPEWAGPLVPLPRHTSLASHSAALRLQVSNSTICSGHTQGMSPRHQFPTTSVGDPHQPAPWAGIANTGALPERWPVRPGGARGASRSTAPSGQRSSSAALQEEDISARGVLAGRRRKLGSLSSPSGGNRIPIRRPPRYAFLRGRWKPLACGQRVKRIGGQAGADGTGAG